MPILFIVLGIGIVVIVLRGKAGTLADVLKDDFTSSNNFIAWLMAFAFIGFIGSLSKTMQPLTNAFSGLVVVVLLLSNRGFFAEFERQALK